MISSRQTMAASEAAASGQCSLSRRPVMDNHRIAGCRHPVKRKGAPIMVHLRQEELSISMEE
jgi:hypothetical protein